jgi:membrane fusion protein, heavy metal efflux system
MKTRSFQKCRGALIAGLLLMQFPAFQTPVSAGPGHDHSHDFPGGDTASLGPVTLTDSQRLNLGLVVVEAEIREMGKTVEVPATLVVPPEKHGVVSATFSGRVVEVLVKLGQEVRAGDPVLKVSPINVGSPPQILTAPISGHVIRQASAPGAAFTPETALVEIGDDRELLAQGIFFQSPALTEIKMGSPANFSLDLFPGESFAGTLQRLDTGHGPEDASFHVYALIDNPEHRLRPNFRGRLAIQVEEAQPVVAVPGRAVLGSLGDLFVFVETDTGEFERRDVVKGIRSGEWVEIVEGIFPGENVVTVGNYQLQYVTPQSGASAHEDGEAHAGHTH